MALAGHSLGQVTALIASGAVSLGDGVRLAVARADASASAQQRFPGGLVALIGTDEETAAAVCAGIPRGAWIANINGPGQVVVGSALEDIPALIRRAEEVGVRRAIRLAVDGAFHTPLMASAASALAPLLDEITFAPARWPVVTNHDAEPVVDPEGWPERLTTHLVRPVRWSSVVCRLAGLGAATVIEVGPGRTLGGLVRRIDDSLAVTSVSCPDDLSSASSGDLITAAVPR